MTLATNNGNVTLPHADFLQAWDPNELVRLVRDCINANVNCFKTSL